MKTHARTAYLVVLLLATALPAFAQLHTLHIQDGKVVVDGRTLTPDEVPPSLRLDGVTADFRFSGNAVVQLGGTRYAIRDGSLVEVADDDVKVLFMIPGQGGGGVGTRWMHGDPAYGAYFKALDMQARTLDRLGAELSASDARPLADRLRQETQEAVAMVRAFPGLELQGYLEDLQGRDRVLYDRMMREQLMDMESRRLASRIASTRDAARRRSLSAELRTRLDEAFELKQQNRRDEIAQLEQRLAEMRVQLAEREKHRDAIIERRLEELVTGNDRQE